VVTTDDALRAELDAQLAAARDRIQQLTLDLRRADTQANNLAQQTRALWTRRVEFLRAHTATRPMH
jgi:hypothetical protein